MKNSSMRFSKLRFLQRANSWVASFSIALTLSYTAGLSADDTELFLSQEQVSPNILLILDTSGSMGSDGTTLGTSRISEMQQALTAWLTTASRVNVGILTFNSTMDMIQEIGPVDTTRSTLLTDVSNLSAGGGTLTLKALWQGQQYFGGEFQSDATTPLLPSPINQECQENHVVLLTDGSPGSDTDTVNIVEDAIYPAGSSEACVKVNVGGTLDGSASKGTCSAELANYMYTTDYSSAIQDVNNITTHTIGFNFSDPWLATISEAGGGEHFDVTNTAALQDAFDTILATASSTYASPTISVNSYNESRHRDELFYAQFQPYGTDRWDGNVKKYRVLNGEIVDADDLPLVDADGKVDENSRSFWSNVDDGEAVLAGGFAAKLPAAVDRKWFTDFNVTPDGNGVITPFAVTTGLGVAANDTKDLLTPASVGAATDEERNDLVDWALGADVEGGDASVNHYFVADTLHNSPVLLSYWSVKNATQEERKEVLFVGNNMGVLHAIDPETGDEVWSYTPEEHLPAIKAYFENVALETGPVVGGTSPTISNGKKTYGLDGSFTVYSTRKATTSYDFEVDTAWLFMTERRGGDRVYGLDVSNGHSGTNPFKVMWKIDGGTDGPFDRDIDGDGTNDAHSFADLGQTWSKPELLDVKYDCPDACKGKKVLMFGGGYNTVYDDIDLDFNALTTPASGHGNAVYFVDPETGERLWSVGNGAHHSLNLPINHSVPSTPIPLDSDADGFIDILFFIDLSGDVWRVDLKKTGATLDDLHLSGGKVAELSPAGQSLRFFNPVDVVLSGNSYSTAYYTLVTGSGMRNSPLYPETSANRLYAIRDRWVYKAPYRKNTSTGLNEPDYRYVTDASGNHTVITADASVLRDVSDTTSTTDVEYGFYKPFALGEKVLQPTRITRNHIAAVTYTPPGAVVDCSPRLGTTRLYLLSLPDGSNAIPSGALHLEVGPGLLSGLQILDTGTGTAEEFLVGPKLFQESELFEPNDSSVFRKFQRTGWVERDGF